MGEKSDTMNLTETSDKVAVEIQRPKLSLFQSCAIIIASMGGAGVFSAMSTLMMTTGSIGVLLITLLVSGMLNFSLANCFTEVAVLLPKAGGPYFFVRHVFGSFAAFLFIWGFFFMIIVPVWAFQSITSSMYILQLFYTGCRPPEYAAKLLAGWLLVGVVTINCLYMRYVTKVQTMLTSTKLLAMLLLIILGVVALVQDGGSNYRSIFEGSKTQPGDFAVSLLSGMFMFGGWQIITFLLEEMKEPERTVPATLRISFAFVITMTNLIVAAYFVVLSTKDILVSEAVAVLFTDRIFRPLSPVIATLVTLSCLGSQNAIVLAQSRLLSATAKMGHMPQLLACSSEKYDMPWGAILVTCMLSLLVLFFLDMTQMILLTSFYATVMCLVVVLCLLALRFQQPHTKRPFKVSKLTIVVQVVLNVAVLLMGIYQQPNNMGIMALFLLAGVPVYYLCIGWKSKPKVINRFMDKMTVFFQKLLILKSPKDS